MVVSEPVDVDLGGVRQRQSAGPGGYVGRVRAAVSGDGGSDQFSVTLELGPVSTGRTSGGTAVIWDRT